MTKGEFIARMDHVMDDLCMVRVVPEDENLMDRIVSELFELRCYIDESD